MLLRYETARDYRRCRLSFRWRSSGVVALDAVNGPVLTIEGRDAAGKTRAWYVRLWNYATGPGDDATVSLDFADLRNGFGTGGPPVWCGDVDRMFVSLAPPGYVEGSTAGLAHPAEGWAELSDMTCDGPGSVLAVGDLIAPEHGLNIATGYDDHYHLTPARMLRSAQTTNQQAAKSRKRRADVPGMVDAAGAARVECDADSDGDDARGAG